MYNYRIRFCSYDNEEKLTNKIKSIIQVAYMKRLSWN